ncbi:hypothetical protein P879_01098 [Paragonimus westermani]|uniref:Kinase D-interacting substrate of 220 kDa-like SAM domain-containing protein n=1 Tax=Paragonimus westermani TaxID=34504 RepID=A0A8T0DXQ3_9TREM|nr:hypothetical protein P879_01098 [Paragonimus westermani]
MEQTNQIRSQKSFRSQSGRPHQHRSLIERRQQSSSSMTSTSREVHSHHVRAHSHNRPPVDRFQTLGQSSLKPQIGIHNKEQSNTSCDVPCLRGQPMNHVHPGQFSSGTHRHIHPMGIEPRGLQSVQQGTSVTENVRMNYAKEPRLKGSTPTEAAHISKGANKYRKRPLPNTMDGTARTNFPASPGYVIPQSSLDNLLGIDVMEMYNHIQPGPEQFEFHTRRPCGPMRPDCYGPQSDSNPITPFQLGCLRSLASMIICPHTVLPITVGLFHRSMRADEMVYVHHLSEQISLLINGNQAYLQRNPIRFNVCTSLVPLFLVLLVAYILGLTLGWQLGLAVAVTATVLYLITCCVISYNLRAKGWSRTMQLSETLSRYMRGFQLLLNILFFRAPPAPTAVQPVRLLPISLNMATCVSGLDAAAVMTEKLWQFAEYKYGKLAVRFQWASKDVFSEPVQTFRKCCCLPLWLWVGLFLLSTLSLATLFAIPNVQDFGSRMQNGSAGKAHLSRLHLESVNVERHERAGHIKNAAIVCGVLSCFSSFVLCAVSIPSLINLIQGRPFQWPKQRLKYGNCGQLGDPPTNGCYAVPASKFDPSSCLRPEALTDGHQFANHVTRPFSAGSADLASAATLAAVAAAAAVTAATSDHQQRRATRGTRAKRSFGAYYDVESQSASSDEEDREDEDESEKFSDSDEEANENLDDRLQNEALLFESGELLLHERGKKKLKKGWHDSTYSQTNGIKSGKKRGDMQTLEKWKSVLRNALLDVCRVLSMIDSRIGGRQTRVLLCVTGTDVPVGSTSAVVKLATFMKLVGRLLMQPPEGGTSGDVTVMLDPKMSENSKESKQEPNEGGSACTLWTPNVIVLVTAAVPSSTYPNCANSLQSTRSMSASLPNHPPQTPLLTPGFPRTNFKFWWTIHHTCHLPIYLEDNPPGYHINEPHRLQHAIIDGHRFSLPTATSVPTNSTLLDLYARFHQLASMNAKYLRQLLTLSAFLGRMINIDRLSAISHADAHVPPRLASRPTSLSTLVTWLCLVQHWPFHAAWLAVFIDQHFREDSKAATESSQPFGSSHILHEDKHSNGSQRAPQQDQLTWDSNLSQLHNRILKRLAPAVETARQKALSASLSAFQSGADFTNRRPPSSYPPHVNSILEMCELALRDRDPRRLAEFLQISEIHQPAVGDIMGVGLPERTVPSFLEAGRVTVAQLISVMKLTPFLNPQITKWIEGKYHGLPKKALSQMSVDEVCSLLRDIVGLSINHKLPQSEPPVKFKNGKADDMPQTNLHSGLHSRRQLFRISDESDAPINDLTPPAAINAQPKPGSRSRTVVSQYEERIKQKNLTGNVLSICSLQEIQKELGMSFGDWQLFSAVINHLKSLEGSLNTRELRRPKGQQTRSPGRTSTHSRKEQLISTVSDTSLPLTVKSAPLDENEQKTRRTQSNLDGKHTTKSMSALNASHPRSRSGDSGYVGRGSTSVERVNVNRDCLLQPMLCHQHSLEFTAQQHIRQGYKLNDCLVSVPKALYCPSHQEQIRSQLSDFQQPTQQFLKGSVMDRNMVRSFTELYTNADVLKNSLPTEHSCRYHQKNVRSHNTVHGYIPPFVNQGSQTLPNTHNAVMNVGHDHGTHLCVVHRQRKMTANSLQKPKQTAYVQRTRAPVDKLRSKPEPGNGWKDGKYHQSPKRSQITGPCTVPPTYKYDSVPSSSLPESRFYDDTNAIRLNTRKQTEELAGSTLSSAKDSASTSLAGEIAEEVADLSPTHLPQDTSTSQDMDANEGGFEVPEHPEDHLCDCNYWYSLDKASTTNNNTVLAMPHSTRRGATNTDVQQSLTYVSAETDSNSESGNSISDSLSTTRSPLDASSGTLSGRTSTESSLENIIKSGP